MHTTPLTEKDASSGFHSGEHALDDYFRRHALSNEEAGVGRTYVLRRGQGVQELPPVLGFYTLSMATVDAAHISALVERRLPRYPMPAALLGRLAVDTRARGRRFGEVLLTDALRRVLEASTLLGCIGMIVDAKNESAYNFYKKYSFIQIQNLDQDLWPKRMFLPIRTIRNSFVK